MFRVLVGRLPWDSVLKGKGVQEGWLLLKKEVSNMQKQAAPLCTRAGQEDQRDVFPEALGEKNNLPPVKEGTVNSGRVQISCLDVQGEN